MDNYTVKQTINQNIQ